MLLCFITFHWTVQIRPCVKSFYRFFLTIKKRDYKGFFCNMIFRQLAGISLTVTTERPFESDLLDFYSHLLLLASCMPLSVWWLLFSRSLFVISKFPAFENSCYNQKALPHGTQSHRHRPYLIRTICCSLLDATRWLVLPSVLSSVTSLGQRPLFQYF